MLSGCVFVLMRIFRWEEFKVKVGGYESIYHR